MEQFTEDKSEAAESFEPVRDTPKKVSVGAQLRAGRESLGLSIDDVVVKIKLSSRQITALEEDDFKSLPETAFLRGFVRSYARLLQMDPQPLLDALPGTVVHNPEPTKVDAPFPTQKTVRQQNFNLLIAALFVVFLIAGFLFWQSHTPRVPVTEADAVIAVSDVAAVATIPLEIASQVIEGSGVAETQPVLLDAPASATPVSLLQVSSAAGVPAALKLSFDKESWVDIKDATGKSLVRQINQPGTELNLEGVPPFTMVIGHSAAVHLYYREKQVDLSPYIGNNSDVARMTLE